MRNINIGDFENVHTKHLYLYGNVCVNLLSFEFSLNILRLLFFIEGDHNREFGDSCSSAVVWHTDSNTSMTLVFVRHSDMHMLFLNVTKATRPKNLSISLSNIFQRQS